MGTLHLLRDMTEADFDRVHAAHFAPARFAAAGPEPGIDRARHWLMPSVAHDDEDAPAASNKSAPSSSCHGGCVQGRMCDCVPAVEEAKPARRKIDLPWLTLRRFVIAYAVAIGGSPLIVHGWKSGWFAGWLP